MKNCLWNSWKEKTLKYAALVSGISSGTIARYCKKYDCENLLGNPNLSSWELKIRDFLDENNIEYERNNRTIIPKREIDFYFSDLKVGIEVGSIFNHSETSRRRGKEYHYFKHITCEEQGIKLYQFFDTEILDNWEITKNKILDITGNLKTVIDADDCIMIKCDGSFDHDEFFSMNGGYRLLVDGINYVYATNDGEIVGGISVIFLDETLLVDKFCVKLGISIPSIFSKMVNDVVADLGYEGDVITFSDNMLDNEKLYEEAGFVVEDTIEPDFKYTRNHQKLLEPSDFTVDALVEDFGVDRNAITDDTMWDVMQELGYDRFWDAGKKLWRK